MSNQKKGSCDFSSSSPARFFLPHKCEAFYLQRLSNLPRNANIFLLSNRLSRGKMPPSEPFHPHVVFGMSSHSDGKKRKGTHGMAERGHENEEDEEKGDIESIIRMSTDPTMPISCCYPVERFHPSSSLLFLCRSPSKFCGANGNIRATILL